MVLRKHLHNWLRRSHEEHKGGDSAVSRPGKDTDKQGKGRSGKGTKGTVCICLKQGPWDGSQRRGWAGLPYLFPRPRGEVQVSGVKEAETYESQMRLRAGLRSH